jgi:hypothetical protein
MSINNQVIFNQVYAHLLKQGKASVNYDGDCMYRGDAGTSCAVGCLIPDDVYTAELERKSMRNVRVHNILGDLGYSGENLPLLQYLQNAHDDELNIGGIETWKLKMGCIAEHFSLLMPE